MQPFRVTVEDAQKFASVWNYKGIVMPLDKISCQFATDYANVAIRSFMQFIAEQAAAKKKAAEEAAKPKITLESA